MPKPSAPQTCAPPSIPSHLSVLWAFDQAGTAVPRDEWPQLLERMGVISAAPRPGTKRHQRLINLCYDLQENGWLPGDARLYKRGIWNGRAKGRRFDTFARHWHRRGAIYHDNIRLLAAGAKGASRYLPNYEDLKRQRRWKRLGL
jgi:hypothetical protein